MGSHLTSQPLVSRRYALGTVAAGMGGFFAGCLGDTSPSDSPAVDAVVFGDVLRWESAYRMAIDGPLGVGTVTVFGEDTYTVWDHGGHTLEAYVIDGQGYIVVDGACYLAQASEDGDIFEPDRLLDAYATATPMERTTIDDTACYVFAVDDGSLAIAVETGYPVQFVDEGTDTLVAFSGWGEPDPIEPPDLVCSEQ